MQSKVPDAIAKLDDAKFQIKQALEASMSPNPDTTAVLSGLSNALAHLNWLLLNAKEIFKPSLADVDPRPIKNFPIRIRVDEKMKPGEVGVVGPNGEVFKIVNIGPGMGQKWTGI